MQLEPNEYSFILNIVSFIEMHSLDFKTAVDNLQKKDNYEIALKDKKTLAFI